MGGNNKTSNISSAGASRKAAIAPGKTSDTKALKKQTEDRNRARREMNARTLQMVQNAVSTVEKKNNQSRNYATQANAMAQQVLSSANNPTVVGNGGSRGGGGMGGGRMGGIMGTAVNVLNSFNNPLKGIFG